MDLIVKAAYLRICDCKTHATIVLANGQIREEFCCVKEILHDLAVCKAECLVSPEEAKFLMSQISNSNLPFDEKDVPLRLSVTALFEDDLPNIAREHAERMAIHADDLNADAN